MSEARPIDKDNLPPPNPDLILVDYEIETRDPMGSFFDTFPNPEAGHELVIYRSSAQRQLLDQASPEEIILFALQYGGFLPDYPEIPSDDSSMTPNRKDKNAQIIEEVTAHRKLIREIIFTAAKYYKETYWGDYEHREHQDIDRTEELYKRSEAYQGNSPLHETLRVIAEDTRNRKHQRLIDALRIVKVILVNDKEPASIDLP